MPAETVIRFVTEWRHAPYGHRTGVFRAAYRVWPGRILPEAERAELRTLLDWFNDHLAKPDRLATSRRAHGAETALSWIRASARQHVTRLRRIAALVERAGIAVDELHTARPGYVVYRDAYQVVALPFADTPQ
ncbi:MAG TPA: hypothetical protein VN656_15255 [Stellaceae bacterium]|nr:hypothetical protein [Stellaceae bacterium]